MHSKKTVCHASYIKPSLKHVDVYNCCEALFYMTQLNIIQQLRCDNICLQCFDAVGWATGRASGL